MMRWLCRHFFRLVREARSRLTFLSFAHPTNIRMPVIDRVASIRRPSANDRDENKNPHTTTRPSSRARCMHIVECSPRVQLQRLSSCVRGRAKYAQRRGKIFSNMLQHINVLTIPRGNRSLRSAVRSTKEQTCDLRALRYCDHCDKHFHKYELPLPSGLVSMYAS